MTTVPFNTIYATETVEAASENTADTITAPSVSNTSFSLGAGVASVIEKAGDPESISPEEIENYDFWGYNNIGIAQVDNHLNVRNNPSEDGKLVGKMSNNAACEILGIDGNWAKIKSGEVEGYACTDYLLTG